LRELNERHEVRRIRSSTGNVESEKNRRNCDFEGDRKERNKKGRTVMSERLTKEPRRNF